MTMLEIIPDNQLREVADWINNMPKFARGRWFRLQMGCVELSTKHIPLGWFQ